MSTFTVQQVVRRKSDGAIGLVTEVTKHKVIVRFAPTGQIRQSPWGPSVDTTGDTGHYFHAFADRIIEESS